MNTITKFILLVTLSLLLVFPVQAKSRHEMCEIAKMAIQTISQKLGDSKTVTAHKRSQVHNQCFTAPISEIEETYKYLIDNWDTIFDAPPSI